MDKNDLIVDMLHSLEGNIRTGFDDQCRMCADHRALVQKRMDKHDKTLYGNGLPGLRTKVYVLGVLVIILCSFHGIKISGLW